MTRMSLAVWTLVLASGCEFHDSGPARVEADADIALPDAAAAVPDAAPPLPPADAGPVPDAAPPPASRIIPLYIAATDNAPEVVEARRAVFEDLLAGIQVWYSEVMGAPYGYATFYYEPVRVLEGHYTEAEWQDFARNGFLYPDGTRTAAGGGCSMWYGALFELEDLGLLEDNDLPAIGTGSFYYVVNGGGDNGSCGAGGVLAASEAKVLDEGMSLCPNGRMDDDATDCWPAGVIAHEGGHGFGLPHASDRPACTGGPSIMDVWWDYDDGPTLCDEDKTDLAASGYFEWHVGP